MYKNNFYITENIGNNALSFHTRKKETKKNPQLFIPSLKKINNFSQIELLEKNTDKITFQDYDFNDTLSTHWGLKNFYHIENTVDSKGKSGIKNQNIYIFDNHNHAYFFWYLARNNNIIKDKALLYHVDEHADYRDPLKYLMKPESYNMQKVFEYTNFSDINVGNYIIPAEKEGLIQQTIQIRSEYSLLSINWDSLEHNTQSIILNIDLDFFQPDLDFIDYSLKKKVILQLAKKADIITIATSPFFINQELALSVLNDLKIISK